MPSCTLARLACLLPLLPWSAQAMAANMLPSRAIHQATGAAALCRTATQAAEAALHVPDAFLSAIARVETGRADPLTGALVAWPWSVNAEGVGSVYATKADAIAAVRALQASGVRSIDVGCMQVNLMHHPEAFASLDQAFDPEANALYAAGFLVALFNQTGSWPHAAAAYHSQTPTLGAPYERRVLAEWATPDAAAAPGRQAASPHAPATSTAALPGAPSAPTMAAASPIGRALPASGVMARPMATGRSLAAYRLAPTRLAVAFLHPG